MIKRLIVTSPLNVVIDGLQLFLFSPDDGLAPDDRLWVGHPDPELRSAKCRLRS